MHDISGRFEMLFQTLEGDIAEIRIPVRHVTQHNTTRADQIRANMMPQLSATCLSAFFGRT